MGWRVFGQRFDTSDFSGLPTITQKVTLSDDSLVLAIRSWIIFYNDPVITSLSMKIYSDNSGAPGKLLYTSSSHFKAEMITDLNGVKEVSFLFNDPLGVPLKGGASYQLALSATGYTGDLTSHIAWKKGYPDPVYTTGLSFNLESLGTSPYALHLFGAPLT